MFWRIIAMLVLLAFNVSAGLLANDNPIQHPVKWFAKYRPCVECPQDSVFAGTITFTPLPEFMKESRVQVEYYCSDDMKHDVIVHPDEYQKEYRISEYKKRLRGPFHAGDTIRVEFTVVPMKVGVIVMTFAFCLPPEVVGDTWPAHWPPPCGAVIAPMILGPDGKVAAMNSPETNEPYATFLGPYPEVMPETLYFYQDPKVPLEIAGRGRQSTKWRFFAIEAAVTTKPDDSGYHHVEFKVSPYHYFPAGVRMHLSRDGNIIYENRSANVSTPISPEDTVRFSVDIKVKGPGPGRFSPSFWTDNPEKGIYGGEMGHGEEEVGERYGLYFGYDETMALQYVTDRGPSSYMEYNHGPYEMGMPKRFTIQLERDRRVAWLQKYIPSLQ
jgi:hypothetical protein